MKISYSQFKVMIQGFELFPYSKSIPYKKTVDVKVKNGIATQYNSTEELNHQEKRQSSRSNRSISGSRNN